MSIIETSCATLELKDVHVRRSDTNVIGRISCEVEDDQLRRELTALDVVMTARYAALEPSWHHYTDDDRARVPFCLGELGVGHHADRSFGTLSSGEQQRVLLARTTMNEPALILLDEPSARLDLGGHEQLVVALATIIRRSIQRVGASVTSCVRVSLPRLTSSSSTRPSTAPVQSPPP